MSRSAAGVSMPMAWRNSPRSSGGKEEAFLTRNSYELTLEYSDMFYRRYGERDINPTGGRRVTFNYLFNRTGLVMLRKNSQKCTRCGACVRSCPLDVQRVYEGRGREVVTSYECHLCLRCVEACPEKGCLEFRWLGKKVTGS